MTRTLVGTFVAVHSYSEFDHVFKQYSRL